MLRLSRGLGLESSRFLEEHGALEVDPASGWPMLRLRLSADGRCPFVSPSGCRVYAHRPTCCRIYPLARALRLDGDEVETTYFVDAPPERCGGHGAPSGFTVEGWARGQGLDESRAANDRLAKLLLHPDRPRPLRLSPAGVHLVVLALYNLSVFRRLVERAEFGAEAGFSAEAVRQALESEEALLALGEAYVAARLWGRGAPAEPG